MRVRIVAMNSAAPVLRGPSRPCPKACPFQGFESRPVPGVAFPRLPPRWLSSPLSPRGRSRGRGSRSHLGWFADSALPRCRASEVPTRADVACVSKSGATERVLYSPQIVSALARPAAHLHGAQVTTEVAKLLRSGQASSTERRFEQAVGTRLGPEASSMQALRPARCCSASRRLTIPTFSLLT